MVRFDTIEGGAYLRPVCHLGSRQCQKEARLTSAKRILLGRIAGAHGLKGDVVVHTYTEAPEDIGSYGPLADATGTRSLSLDVVRVTDKGVIARVAGVADRTRAEMFKGMELWVERDRLPDTADDEFYHADLVGLRAVSPDGQTIGWIIAVQNYGAGDLLEIRLAGVKRTELVPFTDPFVPEIDLAGQRVIVRMTHQPEDAEASEEDAAADQPATGDREGTT
jgi:16S rRNA processing protein RimM